jgi:hypothetical protein
MAAAFDGKQDAAVISNTKVGYQFSCPFQFSIQYGGECALSRMAFQCYICVVYVVTFIFFRSVLHFVSYGLDVSLF